MYQEKRPTAVTVIGWVWIVIGGLMGLSAAMAIFSWVMVRDMAQDNPNISSSPEVFLLLAGAQIGFAALGLVSGINLLRLKAWARNVLEVLTWLLLIFVLGFMGLWAFGWVFMTSGQAPRGFGVMGAAMAVVITAIYGVPLGIMLKYLRGPKVRNATSGTAEGDG